MPVTNSEKTQCTNVLWSFKSKIQFIFFCMQSEKIQSVSRNLVSFIFWYAASLYFRLTLQVTLGWLFFHRMCHAIRVTPRLVIFHRRCHVNVYCQIGQFLTEIFVLMCQAIDWLFFHRILIQILSISITQAISLSIPLQKFSFFSSYCVSMDDFLLVFTKV